jgi:hypothetical protein
VTVEQHATPKNNSNFGINRLCGDDGLSSDVMSSTDTSSAVRRSRSFHPHQTINQK